MFGTLVMGRDAFQEGIRHVFFRRLRIVAHVWAIGVDNGEAEKWEGVDQLPGEIRFIRSGRADGCVLVGSYLSTQKRERA